MRFIRVKLSGLINKKRSRPDLWQIRRYSIINLRERSACLITSRKMFSIYIKIYLILPGVILSTSIFCRNINFFLQPFQGAKGVKVGEFKNLMEEWRKMTGGGVLTLQRHPEHGPAPLILNYHHFHMITDVIMGQLI